MTRQSASQDSQCPTSYLSAVILYKASQPYCVGNVRQIYRPNELDLGAIQIRPFESTTGRMSSYCTRYLKHRGLAQGRYRGAFALRSLRHMSRHLTD